MAFPIIGGSQSGGYLIDNSLRFNDNDSAYLNLSTSGSPTSSKKCTFSFWVKRGNLSIANNTFFSAGSSEDRIGFFSAGIGTDSIEFVFNNTGSGAFFTSDNGSFIKFRDTSAWYHFVVAIDTTLATADDRLKFYQNGNLIPHDNAISGGSAVSGVPITQNYDLQFLTSGNNFSLGRNTDGSGEYLDGYLAEVHFIDGQQLAPTDFAEADEDSGIWKPIEYSGSYGNYGFYLDFENSGSLGADQSGNGNNFTPTNLASTDQTTDTPTNNFATFTPLNGYNQTLTEGNTRITASTGSAASGLSTIAPTSGKWYVEYDNSRQQNAQLGVYSLDDYTNGTDTYNFPVGKSAAITIEAGSNYSINWNQDATGGTLLQNSINLNEAVYGMAVDIDNGNVYFSANGNWYSSVSGAFDKASFSDATAVFSALPTTGDVPIAMMCRGSYDVGLGFGHMNFGNPPPQFPMSSSESDENGYGSFEYAPPSGYLALCTQNLATELSPTIDDGSAYFQTLTYAGNSSARTLTNDGHSDLQPDLIWIKSRTGAQWHHLFDSSRGGDYRLHSNSTNAESTLTNSRITSFNTDGFSTTDGENVNITGNNYVAWQWKANAGSTSSNTDGSITSTVQANTTAGFSIVTWTETTANSQTIGHGLGKTPAMIITKLRDDNVLNPAWYTFHQSIGKGERVMLDSTSGDVTSGFFNGTLDSSVFHVGYGDSYDNKSVVAYCFAEIEGYSKFGKYTGNGSSDGTFVYTGFKPAFIIVKRTDSTGDWHLVDNKRNGFNVDNDVLLANKSDAEFDVTQYDILSNGFKLRSTANSNNASGGTYIYMAFAENPFVTSGAVPVTAR